MTEREAVRAATRGSPLARWQTDHVASLLGVPVEAVVVETSGDVDQERPLWEIGGQGAFVKDVQVAVLDGRADIAVHSAKDVPTTPTPGLLLFVVGVRADPRDALVGSTLRGLAPGATVATGSVRRRAQLAAVRPDLEFVSLRGNMATRLSKVPPSGAIVVAVAALDRLGLRDRITEVLEPDVMLPQVGQGALAVECRADDEVTAALLSGAADPHTAGAVLAERAFLTQLGTGCDLPAAAHATVSSGSVTIDALVATLDGRRVVRAAAIGDDPLVVGADVAREVLDVRGGRALLDRDRGRS